MEPTATALEAKKTSRLVFSVLPTDEPSRQALAAFLAGGFAGTSNAALFNWWDKGLYESVKNNRPFLARANFDRPWQGLQAAIVSRILSYGLYFPVNETFESAFRSSLGDHPELLRLAASQSTGVVLSLPLAPISSVKYRMWGSSHAHYLATAAAMWREGGVRPFFHGIRPTLYRDCLWSSIFSCLRFEGIARSRALQTSGWVRDLAEFSAVTAAGAVATIISSPFNYARNAVYATAHGTTPRSTWQIISSDLLCAARRHEAPVAYLQQKLMLGWGTARVAVGMAVASKMYELSKEGFVFVLCDV